MAEPYEKVPQQEDLKKLHRWARVALIARTARRIQPLYLKGWPKAPRKFLEAIEAAIAEGELAASQGKPTPDLNDAGLRAMDVYGESPDKLIQTADYIDHVPYTASRVSFAGRESDGFFAADGLGDAMWAVYYYARARKLPKLMNLVAKLVWNDFRTLEAAAKSNKWKGTSPVTPEVFGPMWPDGPPQGWPAASAAPKSKKPRRKPAGPNLKELKLPKDLLAFLKAGQKLKYNAAKSAVGRVVLKPLDHLKLGTFEVLTEETPAHENDPKRGKSGHYLVNGVDLVAECDAYGPDGILAWLPDDKCFATYDPDHMHLIVFPKTTWTQIAKAQIGRASCRERV